VISAVPINEKNMKISASAMLKWSFGPISESFSTGSKNRTASVRKSIRRSVFAENASASFQKSLVRTRPPTINPADVRPMSFFPNGKMAGWAKSKYPVPPTSISYKAGSFMVSNMLCESDSGF